MIKRTLTFEQIVERKFDKNADNEDVLIDDLQKNIKKQVNKIMDKLRFESGVRVAHDWIKIYHSQDKTRWFAHCKLYVAKEKTCNLAWDDIMGIINSVQAPYYKFIKLFWPEVAE